MNIRKGANLPRNALFRTLRKDSWFCLKVEQYFSLYAVFDGHGSKGLGREAAAGLPCPESIVRYCDTLLAVTGHKVSQFVKDNLPKLILMVSQLHPAAESSSAP